MRAGNLDRTISLEWRTTGLDLYGTPIDVWKGYKTLRAQALQNAKDDRETAGGNRTDTTISFRIRWIDDVNLENRVVYDRQTFTIRQIKEIGRRVGLDLVCERVGL